MPEHLEVKAGVYGGDLKELLNKYSPGFNELQGKKSEAEKYFLLVKNNLIMASQNLLGFDPQIPYTLLIAVIGAEKRKVQEIMKDLESKLEINLVEAPEHIGKNLETLKILFKEGFLDKE
jgi:hypothetical protein